MNAIDKATKTGIVYQQIALSANPPLLFAPPPERLVGRRLLPCAAIPLECGGLISITKLEQAAYITAATCGFSTSAQEMRG